MSVVKRLSSRSTNARPKLIDKSCRFCKRTMRVTEQGYLENPFCNKCLLTRVEIAVAEANERLGVVAGFVIEGNYSTVVRSKDVMTGPIVCIGPNQEM